MILQWNRKNGLDLKTAFFLCWKLWEWLAKTGNQFKRYWPEWKENGGDVNLCFNECPCCEYTFSTSTPNRGCHECIMIDLWGEPDEKDKEENGVPCSFSDSPFNLWYATKSKPLAIKERKKYAKIIAKEAKKKYKALCLKERK
jgi:hypothetical protein